MADTLDGKKGLGDPETMGKMFDINRGKNSDEIQASPKGQDPEDFVTLTKKQMDLAEEGARLQEQIMQQLMVVAAQKARLEIASLIVEMLGAQKVFGGLSQGGLPQLDQNGKRLLAMAEFIVQQYGDVTRTELKDMLQGRRDSSKTV